MDWKIIMRGAPAGLPLRGVDVSDIVPGKRCTSSEHRQHEQEGMAHQQGAELDTHDDATRLL